MPLPAVRSKLLPLRGLKANLDEVLADILEGEFCYATDQDQYYQKEDGVLVAVGATKVQGALAESALQDAPSDGSEYVRKDGTWAIATGGGIEEAPADGNYYMRHGSAWVPQDLMPMLANRVDMDGGDFDIGHSEGAFLTSDGGDFDIGQSTGVDASVDGGVFD